jgi:hypothetical protein
MAIAFVIGLVIGLIVGAAATAIILGASTGLGDHED